MRRLNLKKKSPAERWKSILGETASSLAELEQTRKGVRWTTLPPQWWADMKQLQSVLQQMQSRLNNSK